MDQQFFESLLEDPRNFQSADGLKYIDMYHFGVRTFIISSWKGGLRILGPIEECLSRRRARREANRAMTPSSRRIQAVRKFLGQPTEGLRIMYVPDSNQSSTGTNGIEILSWQHCVDGLSKPLLHSKLMDITLEIWFHCIIASSVQVGVSELLLSSKNDCCRVCRWFLYTASRRS